MTSEGMGEMFEGDSADMPEKFLLVSIGGRAELPGLACADPRARTPISASGNSYYFQSFFHEQFRSFVLIFMGMKGDPGKMKIYNCFSLWSFIKCSAIVFTYTAAPVAAVSFLAVNCICFRSVDSLTLRAEIGFSQKSLW